MRRRAALMVTLILVTLSSAVAGCSLMAGDGADEAADRLASSLSALTLDGVELTSESDRERFEAAVDGMGDVTVAVSVAEVDTGDATATVSLSWTWELDKRDWRYTTTATLRDSLGVWELDWEPETLAPGLRSGERLDHERSLGNRGRILGAGGTPLVTDRPVLRYGLDKSQVRRARWDRRAVAVARALGVDATSYRDEVRAYGDQAFVEAIVLRPEDAATQVSPSYARIPGAAVLEDEIPLAPTRSFASAVLGSVGPATAEIIKDSGGAVDEGREVGLSGLQARYDEQLRATPGTRVSAVRVDGSERTLFGTRGRDGRDLRTTIDPDLQIRAEQALADYVRESGPDSALVALRPSTGEVLAVANGPANEGFNAATTGQYPPGSTFKVVSALALLRSGMHIGDPVLCPSTTTVDGRSFKNYDDYPSGRLGAISFTTAVANSCNTALIDERERLDEATLTEAAAALGLGVDHDLGFSAYFGQAPPAEGETERAANLIGQGKILASPMAMAAVAASAVVGRTVLPVLLPEHEVVQQMPSRPLAEGEAQRLRALMRAVVTEGSGGFLADLPGDVGAKTGTAEYGEPAADGSLPTHTWMIAFRDDLAVAVFVETGVSGSQTAGPILKAFLR